MARRVTLAVLLIASIIFNLCASADVRRQRIVDWDGRFSFAAEDVNIWLADDEGVWRSYKRTTPKLVVELSGVTALDACDGGVYALRKDGADDIVSFIEPENGVAQEWLLPDLGGYCGVAALQDKIALLAGKQDECTLVFLDKANGTVQEIEGAENLAYISRRDETSVFASSLTEGKIISVATDGTIEEIFRGGFYAKSVYEKADGTLLLFGQSEGLYMLLRLKPGEEPEELGIIDIPGLIYGGKIAGDKLYVDVSQTLYQIDIAELETTAERVPTQTLTIVHDDFLSPSMLNITVRAFKEQNPGVEVRFIGTSPEELVLMLMSNASQYDLLYLEWSGADPIIRADIVADLSAYPVIMEQKKHWIDIGAMYDAQGRWLRVPVDLMSPEVLIPVGEDLSILENTGVVMNGRGINYTEFLDLARKTKTDGKCLMGIPANCNRVFFLYSVMAGNSLEGGLMHFDTQEFRQAMEFWKRLYDEELVVVANSGEKIDSNKVFIGFDGVKHEGTQLEMFNGILLGNYLYMPTPNGDKVCPVQVDTALYMNRHGKQKDLAAEFIATYMSPAVQRTYHQVPEGSSLYLNDLNLYGNIEEGIQFYWEYDFEAEMADYGNWIDVLENTRYYGWNWEMRGPFQSMVREYLAGELELEEFVAEMEKLADIWMNE